MYVIPGDYMNIRKLYKYPKLHKIRMNIYVTPGDYMDIRKLHKYPKLHKI